MKILIADDAAVSRELLQTLLEEWGYETCLADDGPEALAALQAADGASLAILDWVMPGLEGPAICQQLRAEPVNRPLYLILLTSLEERDHVVTGLRSGADDFLHKPFDPAELRARVQAGERIVRLELELRDKVQELQEALANVKQLQGLLPICSYCKKIRDDQDYWHQLDRYISSHAEIRFSHGICPSCYAEVMEPQIGGEPSGDSSD